MQQMPEVDIAVTPGIPYWFGILVIVVAVLLAIALVQMVAELVAQARIKNHRERQLRWRGKQTFVALAVGVAAGLLVGFNVHGIWYLFNGHLQAPDDNVAEVRASFADQGANSLELRDTDPPNSLVMLDEEKWRAGVPLHMLLACDAGQFPMAGQYPAYDGFDWKLPVQYSTDDGIVDAVLDRTVTDETCTFTLVPAED